MVGTKSLLLLRVDFSDANGAAISQSDATNLVAALNDYYREMSYGRAGFSLVGSGSVVTPALRLPEPSSAYDNNFTKLLTDARAAAAAAGFAHEAFDSHVVFTGSKPFLVFGALAYQGGPGVWIGNNNFNVGVLGHELGHNFGLLHASLWNPTGASALGSGLKVEYGDPFDSMGVPGGSVNHFNARFKHLLGWLDDADAPLITQSGTYRLYAEDHPDARGIRALRIARSADLVYWLEFRQFFKSQYATNGLLVRWAGSAEQNTLLLDTTPGSAGGRNDAPLIIGRTLSDPCIDFHITPIAEGEASPNFVDVVIQRGPFVDNAPPQLELTAGALSANVGQAISFEARAADANGDSLAYSWDFGDFTVGENKPSLSHAWLLPGEFVVRCTVSDMKGGTASKSLVVRIGTFSTFQISGSVLREGAPVPDALVRVLGTTRIGWSDSDGTYVITRVNSGTYEISADMDRANCFPLNFSNPVTVGPNAAGLTFLAVPDDLNMAAIISKGAVWKYLADASAPAGNWTGIDFNDASWKSGPAKLGFGAGDEATPIQLPDPNQRPTTVYFRRLVNIVNPQEIGSLVFRLRRDDGAVIYWNGTELFREN
ncbi:MAG: PKD domain-containing protein, partial [Verrucomicrobiota bacterium]